MKGGCKGADFLRLVEGTDWFGVALERDPSPFLNERIFY